MNKIIFLWYIYKESEKMVFKNYTEGYKTCVFWELYLGPGQHLWVGRNSCQDLTQHDPEREDIDLQFKRAENPQL